MARIESRGGQGRAERPRQEPEQDRVTGYLRARLNDEGGYLLLWAVFCFVVLGGIAVVSLRGASSERRGAKTNVEFGNSFSAAEAGLQRTLATVSEDTLDAMQPGDSVDLGWTGLTGSLRYGAWIRRVDDGSGDELYDVTVAGRGGGLFAGQTVLSMKTARGGGSSPFPNKSVYFADGGKIGGGGGQFMGACADAHSNGDLLADKAVTTGEVSAVGSVSGTPLTPTGDPAPTVDGADPIDVPLLDPYDFLDDADYIARNGYIIDVAAGDSAYADAAPEAFGLQYESGDQIYKVKDDTYFTMTGTIWVEGSINLGGGIGKDGDPVQISLITTNYTELSGGSFIDPVHPGGIAVLAGGDVKFTGGSGSIDVPNYKGIVYAGGHCVFGGGSIVFGQVVCMGQDPVGKSIVKSNEFTGGSGVRYECESFLAGVGGSGSGTPLVPIDTRAWAHVY